MARYQTKTNIISIHLMATVLHVVVILMFLFKLQRHIFPTFTNKLDQFEEAAKVLDRTYYNKPFRFSISAPDSNWEFVYSATFDSSEIPNSQAGPIVTMYRLELDDTLSLVKIEIFQLSDIVSAQNLASLNLAQVKNQYMESDEDVRVVADVVTAGSGSMIGAYYVVELPSQNPHPFPIWVVMYSVRDELAYKISCQIKRDKYDSLRPALEDILKSFLFL